MADLEHFEFKVLGYTPDTMPLDRLIEYLNQLMVILGQPSDLHLINIKKSSTMPVLAMRHDVAVKARENAKKVWQGGGSVRKKEAFQNIRRMVSEDGGKPAILKTKEGKIIEFPRVDLGLDQEISAVRQPTTLTGKLVRIGGIGEYAQLLIQEPSGDVIAGCMASRAIAQNMGNLLYKSIRVSGDGSWQRTADGKWEINRLNIQSFEELSEDELEDVLGEIYKLTTDWTDDAAGKLLSMREDAA